MKTEAREVKRRGKYNKDKAGNLGKLGRKAMKEVKVDQVIVKKQTLNVNFFRLTPKVKFMHVFLVEVDIMRLC